MSHQDGLGNNGTEPTGLTKPDDGDDRMQKKSENVAHPQDRIKLKKPQISGRLRNSPRTRLLYESSLVLRDELLDVHCVRSGELPDQTIRHLEDAVLEVRHDRLAVAFEMVVIAHAE
jgi:hypothetical protein